MAEETTTIPNGYTTTEGKDYREEYQSNPDMIKTKHMAKPLPDDLLSEKYNKWLDEERSN